MSHIHFHTQEQRADIWGVERGRFANLCTGLTIEILGLNSIDPSEIATTLRELWPRVSRPGGGAYIGRGIEEDRIFAQQAASAVRAHQEPLMCDGGRISFWEMALNTALVVGSDPIKMAARLHGQCELHAWVAGRNRSWLANIISEGLDGGVFRRSLKGHSTGWEELIAVLRSSDNGPVVTSYSTSGQFPRLTAMRETWPTYCAACRVVTAAAATAERDGICSQCSLPYEDDRQTDAWGRLTSDERWEAATWSLDARRELRPDDWRGSRFGPGLTAFDLVAEDWRQRVRDKYPAPKQPWEAP